MTFYQSLSSYYDKIFPLNDIALSYVSSYFSKGDKVLDIGAGTGNLALALAEAGFQVTASEPDIAMMENISEKSKSRGLPLAIHSKSMEQITELSGNFDGIICVGNTLPHLQSKESIEQFIAEAFMKLKNLANNSIQEAYVGGKSVEKVVEQMNEMSVSVEKSQEMMQALDKRSNEVNSILTIITTIAEQTNLLSLNASIEAARVGEHGKGFAVVANEVKQLATQSQESAQNIYSIISAMNEDTKNTVALMQQIANQVNNGVVVSTDALVKFNQIINSLEQVLPQIEKVSSTIQQVSASIQETTAHVNEVAVAAEQNASTSEHVASSAEQQLLAIEDISSSAQALTELATELQSMISKFKY